MLRLVAFTSIMLINTLTYAQVPHVFVAGERASAQQVNENFADVDARIASLEGTACTNYSRAHVVSYSARPSNIGDEIIFLGNSYRMIKVPFVEFGTGDRYTIMYPEVAQPSGDVRLSLLRTWHEGLDEKCVTTTIAGHPSRIFVNELRQTRVFNDGFSASNSTYIISVTLHIVVNETLIQMTIEVTSAEQEDVVVGIGDYDFSDNLDTGLMLHRNDLIFAADDLIDYIRIQAEP